MYGVLRHSSECKGNRLPTELRKASAVCPEREDGEESIAAVDKEGNEKTSSKARTINIISGVLTVTDGTATPASQYTQGDDADSDDNQRRTIVRILERVSESVLLTNWNRFVDLERG
jgi:hypothetical protein